ncbi:hypothetical protein OROGR_001508 [Orobanche gracilis]
MPNKTWFSNDDDDDDGEGKEMENEENNRDEMSQEYRHEDDESFPGSREQSH